jgi:hypothetical protein
MGLHELGREFSQNLSWEIGIGRALQDPAIHIYYLIFQLFIGWLLPQ